ncbi:MAG TPA: alkaline phosphatase family protein [Rhizomicrobium sp.]|jgi:arylsulfatase A-like enzyme|nr:alkaline phosphatase family protein [Rhizomicrobium sp.]
MKLLACALVTGLLIVPAAAQGPRPHNVIIFVADGLRYGSVEPGNMPNMARLKSAGVDFTNSHSLYPTVTTVNASAIATGHGIGDTGDFGNTLYVGTPMVSLKGSTLGFLENDTVLDEMNQKFGGNYLDEVTLLAAARAKGFQTAIVGKEGPARIQDSTADADGNQTLIIDDSSGREGGLGLPNWFTANMRQAFVGNDAPKTNVPNIAQEVWMMKATTRIVLPHFQSAGKPFALLFWSRDPDASQHGTRDSIGEMVPGINGPSGLAGTRDADTMLGELLAYLKASGLDKTTDVFVTADHGFATINHSSATSPSAHFNPSAPLVDLPSGFLAIDLAASLGMPLRAPGDSGPPLDFSNGAALPGGSAMLGSDPRHPDVVVAANGGSDLIYLPAMNAKDDPTPAKETATDIVKFLATQDYVSGIFVNDKLGKFPGALSMSDVGLMGAARTPQPAIYVNFRSFSSGCANEQQCTVVVMDTPLATGQGNHGSFSRGETRNFMAAVGPDFKSGYADPTPISNADIAPTMAHVMGFELPTKGVLKGRVIGEALAGGADTPFRREVEKSAPGPDGVQTILDFETVGTERYLDAAGFEGKTVGLKAQ